MSFIGSLEQFDFVNILRRIEVFSKTGLLVVKQEEMWIEFYVRQGQLVCVGPLRARTNLLDRLVQADLLSAQILPQVQALVGPSEANETKIALALINEGYLSREDLRAWASHETARILQAVLSWPTGKIYFEDDYPAPADRLLVALSLSMLLDLPQAVPDSSPASPLQEALPGVPSPGEALALPPVSPVTPQVQLIEVGPAGQMLTAQLDEQTPPLVASPPVIMDTAQPFVQAPTFAPMGGEAANLLSAAHLIEEFPLGAPEPFAGAQFAKDTPPLSFISAAAGSESDLPAPPPVSFLPPQPVARPLPPARIDTSFMTPDLVLAPVDLSSLRAHNPQVQLTPEQWRLFALINGQVTLLDLCQALAISAAQVCAVAGELIALGLVMPPPGSVSGLPQPMLNVMRNSGMVPTNFPGVPSSAWPQQTPGPVSFTSPVEAQSQWGNGYSGANFAVRSDWMVAAPHQVPPSDQGQPRMAFAPAGGYR